MCEGAVDSTIAGVQTGTAKFFEYFNTDEAHAKQVLVDVVIPVVTSRELACSTAQTDVAHVRKAATTPDKFMDDAAPVIDAQLARPDSRSTRTAMRWRRRWMRMRRSTS